MGTDLNCWNCGASLADQLLPLSRLALCSKCHSYLHCCRLCYFYEPALSRRCREQDADEVTDKERANFCSYFRPKPGAYTPGAEARNQSARARLGALFGDDNKTNKKPES